MKQAQLLRNLSVPQGRIDVILDTDAYNEVDDQYAIAYMLRSQDKLNVKGIYAAPFHNKKSKSPKDGMEKSYDEIHKILKLAGAEDKIPLVKKGSETYLPNESTPVESEAVDDLIEISKGYNEDSPLYIVAIGAITNIASAIIKDPTICDRIVIVWLGGNATWAEHNCEFNLQQDIAAARIIFGCGAPFVQLPCTGVVDSFRTSGPELAHWLIGKNPLATYLAENTVKEAESYAKGHAWTRVIWDVTAVAWLLNEDNRYMKSRLIHSPIPEYDNRYAYDLSRHFMQYVYSIDRDMLFGDLFNKLLKEY
ncbi:MAG: nucleoside hydrolase [Eubacteriales bacterium]|nr:nucleoside hydrolase [Eubacteriales bacterium]